MAFSSEGMRDFIELADKEREMMAGYMDRLDSGSKELPDCHKHKSAAYRHGWLNGRDDRIHKPREKASVLRARAGMIIGDSK